VLSSRRIPALLAHRPASRAHAAPARNCAAQKLRVPHVRRGFMRRPWGLSAACPSDPECSKQPKILRNSPRIHRHPGRSRRSLLNPRRRALKARPIPAWVGATAASAGPGSHPIKSPRAATSLPQNRHAAPARNRIPFQKATDRSCHALQRENTAQPDIGPHPRPPAEPTYP
jgi:hypothetical protein